MPRADRLNLRHAALPPVTQLQSVQMNTRSLSKFPKHLLTQRSKITGSFRQLALNLYDSWSTTQFGLANLVPAYEGLQELLVLGCRSSDVQDIWRIIRGSRDGLLYLEIFLASPRIADITEVAIWETLPIDELPALRRLSLSLPYFLSNNAHHQLFDWRFLLAMATRLRHNLPCVRIELFASSGWADAFPHAIIANTVASLPWCTFFNHVFAAQIPHVRLTLAVYQGEERVSWTTLTQNAVMAYLHPVIVNAIRIEFDDRDMY
ncbi:uncharacterized protein PHACADRAFT_31551 [Phanerochaete carnosa HHB-10118-sp]|uniref:Uncharacterized protein n=1 Tax=Phanerochaete carnosa (strain HHB-10118-sp) TaxID=650164 RepID=K5VK36_PHACS|nr:uncharacterized protein PHACADRAFT_31551 [Phanerochaete carnosa HHB-10118-sp]EKM51733.1 hypothetical protein PHACADRAFT_31551 [Phanerochaete carnosa HHB-10118-sp]